MQVSRRQLKNLKPLKAPNSKTCPEPQPNGLQHPKKLQSSNISKNRGTQFEIYDWKFLSLFAAANPSSGGDGGIGI
jgi:hypothetical protein